MLSRSTRTSGLLLIVLLSSSPAILRSQGSGMLIIPHFVSHPEIESYLYIADVEGTGPSVSVVFYDEGGNKLSEQTVLVQKDGNATIEPFLALNRVAVGTIRIAADEGSVVAEYWQLVNRPKVGEMYSIAVPGQPDSGNKILILQHFVSHPDVQSHIFVSDVESMGPIVNVKLFSETGALLGQARELVPRNGTLDINPFKILNEKVIGTAQIQSEGGSIVGEYWQIVNRKYSKSERETNPDLPKREHYAVTVPLQGTRATSK